MKQPDRVLGLTLALVVTLLLGACATGSGNGMHRADTPKSRENAAAIHTELGHRLMQQGRLKPALEKLKIALQFDSNYAPAHTVLGALYARIGKLPQAEEHYRRAVQIKPTDGATNNNYAVFLCQEGKTQKALPYFKKALADPFYQTPAVAWTNTGVCRLHAGQVPQAIKDFKQAIDLNPHYADALYQMALAQYGQGDAFHASAFIQRYMALGQPDAKALKLGYDIAINLGNVEGARDYARQLRTKFPDSKQALALDARATP